MLHKIDTVIVGGGQAGLAMSYYLTQEGREHRPQETFSANQRR
jgi:putative flavoprotein involved in K+ transport